MTYFESSSKNAMISSVGSMAKSLIGVRDSLPVWIRNQGNGQLEQDT